MLRRGNVCSPEVPVTSKAKSPPRKKPRNNGMVAAELEVNKQESESQDVSDGENLDFEINYTDSARRP